MTVRDDIDKLDQLLSLPAQIADRGFSFRVQQELKIMRTKRYLAFTCILMVWLVLCLSLASPAQLILDFAEILVQFELTILPLVNSIANTENFMKIPSIDLLLPQTVIIIGVSALGMHSLTQS